VSSPRYMVTVLPGSCRVAALEVEELSDKHISPSTVEQGALLAVQWDLPCCRQYFTFVVADHNKCCADAQIDRADSNSRASTSAGPKPAASRERQTCDYTLLAACVHELRQRWLPAKVDQVIGLFTAAQKHCV
jgi:hypothetical protein